MAYTKTLWKNRLVERPRTFRFQQNADGSVTLNPEEGQIIEAGTPVNAEKLNKIEDAVEAHETQLGEKAANTDNTRTTMSKTVTGAINELNSNKVNANNYVANNAFATTAGTATAYTITLNPAPTALVDGMQITILPHIDCGASPTLKINALTALTIVKQDGSAISAGEIKANKPLSLVRVGSNFFIRSSGGGIEIPYLSNAYPWDKGISDVRILQMDEQGNIYIKYQSDYRKCDKINQYYVSAINADTYKVLGYFSDYYISMLSTTSIGIYNHDNTLIKMITVPTLPTSTYSAYRACVYNDGIIIICVTDLPSFIKVINGNGTVLSSVAVNQTSDDLYIRLNHYKKPLFGYCTTGSSNKKWLLGYVDNNTISQDYLQYPTSADTALFYAFKFASLMVKKTN